MAKYTLGPMKPASFSVFHLEPKQIEISFILFTYRSFHMY
jgi:hypothetical protein